MDAGQFNRPQRGLRLKEMRAEVYGSRTGAQAWAHGSPIIGTMNQRDSLGLSPNIGGQNGYGATSELANADGV